MLTFIKYALRNLLLLLFLVGAAHAAKASDTTTIERFHDHYECSSTVDPTECHSQIDDRGFYSEKDGDPDYSREDEE